MCSLGAAVRLAQFLPYMAMMGSNPLGGRLAKEESVRHHSPYISRKKAEKNLFLQKEGRRFPSETEALMKGRGQKIGRNYC